MKFLKSLFSLIGLIVVAGFLFAYFKFDLGTRISQAKSLDPEAMGLYMKMMDDVLTTGDAAKAMVIKRKLKIEPGQDKKEAIQNALEIMDEVGEEYGLAMVDTKLMSRGEKDSMGVYQPYIRIRSYCSPTIAKIFLGYSPEYIGFMPCRIGIVEDKNGDIYLYTMAMGLMIHGGKPLPPKLLNLAQEVQKGMYTMLEKAANGEDD